MGPPPGSLGIKKITIQSSIQLLQLYYCNYYHYYYIVVYYNGSNLLFHQCIILFKDHKYNAFSCPIIYPRGGGGTWPGYPPRGGVYTRVPPRGGGVPDQVPPGGGGGGGGPGTPRRCLMAFWEMLQSIMGYGYPPPVDRQMDGWKDRRLSKHYLLLRTRAVIMFSWDNFYIT